MFHGILYGKQCAMNAELPNYDKMGRAEKSARRRAREAELRFRIEKGYEKDSFWTHMKYRYLKRD